MFCDSTWLRLYDSLLAGPVKQQRSCCWIVWIRPDWNSTRYEHIELGKPVQPDLAGSCKRHICERPVHGGGLFYSFDSPIFFFFFWMRSFSYRKTLQHIKDRRGLSSGPHLWPKCLSPRFLYSFGEIPQSVFFSGVEWHKFCFLVLTFVKVTVNKKN